MYIKREFWKNFLPLTGLLVIALLVGLTAARRAAWWGESVNIVTAGDMGKCLYPLFGIGVLLLLESVLTIGEGKLISLVFDRVFLAVRQQCFSRLLNADLKTLEQKYGKGNLILRIASETDRLNEMLTSNFTWFSRTILLGLISLVVCAVMCWQLACIFFLLIPVFLKLSDKISEGIQSQQASTADYMGDAMDTALNFVETAEVVKAACAERWIGERYGKCLELAQKENRKSEKVNAWLVVAKYGISILQLLILFTLGYGFIRWDILTIGEYTTFVLLSENVRGLLELSPHIISTVQEGKALAIRIEEICELPEEENGVLPWNEGSAGANLIEIRNLTFSYQPEREILKNLSLKIPSGSRIGIIGESGFGKSTILKLLCGFYPAGTDCIFWKGEAYGHMDKRQVRNRIALVPQEPFLFDGSIYENVCCGRMGVPKKTVQEALEKARLWKDIEGFLLGMDTQVGENGKNLSGGQRQKLAIARAFLKDAQVVLLDEATSALDQKAEAELEESLDELLRGRTAVIVTHRMHGVAHADYIYCIADGKIAEEGTPQELRKRHGYFYRMLGQQGLLKEGAMGHGGEL